MAEPNARDKARPPAAVTLLWGEDEFLLRDAAHARLRARGVEAIEIDAKLWQGGETSDLSTPSLWGERRALLVLGAQNLPDHGVRELEAYVEAPSPEAMLVVTALARAGKPPKWAVSFRPPAATVAQVTLRRQELPDWLAERAASQGFVLSHQGATALTATLGEDPATLHQAVIQLASAFQAKTVGPAEVTAQFQGVGEQRVWDLCDRAFAGRLGEALVALRSMLDEREDALVILGGIASRVRDLIKVRALPDRIAPAEAVRRAGLRFDWQLRRYREQASRFSAAELQVLHGRVVEADRALKGGVPGSVLLPTLVAAMAGQPEAALDVEIRSSR
jgi:DNA polymerase III subunit delta